MLKAHFAIRFTRPSTLSARTEDQLTLSQAVAGSTVSVQLAREKQNSLSVECLLSVDLPNGNGMEKHMNKAKGAFGVGE